MTITMSPDLLNVALLLSLGVCLAVGAAVREDILEVEGKLGKDSILACTADHKPGVQYLAVRWYKVAENQSSPVNGLLTRDLPNGTTRWYSGVEKEVVLEEESHNILIPNVTCSDNGMYRCHLAAPVGEQNQDGHVRLILTGCPAGPTEKLDTDDYLIIFASGVIMIVLLLSFISYVCLTKGIRERNKQQQQQQSAKKQILLNAKPKPLEPKDLKLIYTLGPKPSTKSILCV